MKLLFCLLILFNLSISLKAYQEGDSNEVLIASLNLLYGTPADLDNAWENRGSRAIANLQDYKEGIICLQEVNEKQIKEILKKINEFDIVYRTQGLNNGDGKANAILFNSENWRLIEEETFWLSDTPSQPASKTWGNFLPRIATVVVLERKSNSQRIRVLNTLLDHRSEPSRMKSIDLILNKLANYKEQYPTILAGDFNALADDISIKNILQDYTDTYTGLPLEGCTYHEFYGGKNCPRIDYIFHRNSDAFEMKSSGIDRFKKNRLFPSDHYLIYAWFTLK